MSGGASVASPAYPVNDMTSSLPSSAYPHNELDANRQMANILKKVVSSVTDNKFIWKLYKKLFIEG